LEMRREYQF